MQPKWQIRFAAPGLACVHKVHQKSLCPGDWAAALIGLCVCVCVCVCACQGQPLVANFARRVVGQAKVRNIRAMLEECLPLLPA